MVDLPKEIVWDYPEPPQDDMQRLADFFPYHGRDRDNVRARVQRLPELKVPPEVAELIRLYAEHYDACS
jgi:hypothetical protein